MRLAGRQRLAALVEKHKPQEVRQAEERVREAEREERTAALGDALWRRIEAGRGSFAGAPTGADLVRDALADE